MFNSYLKIAWRNILRQKSYSLINICGLGIGMATCVLIMLWVQSELSFDRFNENFDRIHRLTVELNLGGNTRHGATSSAPMGPAIVERYPEAVAATILAPVGETWIEYENRQYKEDNVLYADSGFLHVFTFPMIAGDPNTALDAAYSAVLTEDAAKKYFGDNEAVGRVLRLDNENDYTVTGVVENVPANSHLDFDILLSYRTVFDQNPQEMGLWGRLGLYSYILLDERADAAALESKTVELVDENLGERLKAVGGSVKLSLQPLRDIHLRSQLEAELGGNGNIMYVFLFSGIALLVLLMACFNFINLTTARSARRALEVSVRKTFGGARGQLIVQFLGEAALCSLLAALLATVLVATALPAFNDLTGQNLSSGGAVYLWLIPAIIGFSLLVGVLAGSFPAFHLSSFRPLSVLKGGISSPTGKSNLRRILVVIQFSLTIALIIGTMVIYQQINYIQSKDLGFDHEYRIALTNMSSLPEPTRQSLQRELSGIPGVVRASAASAIPFRGAYSMMNVLPEGASEEENQLALFMAADDRFVDAMGMQLIAGRNFSPDLATDSARSVLINDAAAQKFGWVDPVGKTVSHRVRTPEGPAWEERTVVGVIADFHNSSLREKIEPLIITRDLGMPMQSFGFLVLSLSPAGFAETIDRIEARWNELAVEQPIDMLFLDNLLAEQYQTEKVLAKLTVTFSLLAVLIGCLGLFGMASYAAEQRTKEIGIRKTMGAPVHRIISLLSRESLILVALSNLLAWPIAAYMMNRWLSEFAYRTSLQWTTFAAAGFLTILIAMATISFQSIRAAVRNPIHSLRHE